VVTVDGDVDVYSATVLREQPAALSEAGHHRIALNLSAMTFCDSTGLGVLIGAVKCARDHGGGLALYGAPEHMLRVLRITGLVKVIPPFEQRAEALGWLAAQ
jgi:anti-sigma B factor antagonist